MHRSCQSSTPRVLPVERRSAGSIYREEELGSAFQHHHGAGEYRVSNGPRKIPSVLKAPADGDSARDSALKFAFI